MVSVKFTFRSETGPSSTDQEDKEQMRESAGFICSETCHVEKVGWGARQDNDDKDRLMTIDLAGVFGKGKWDVRGGNWKHARVGFAKLFDKLVVAFGSGGGFAKAEFIAL